MNDLINRQDTIKAIDEAFQMGDCYCDKFAIKGLLNSLPSVESMTIHEVALILEELFDDPCACNYNGTLFFINITFYYFKISKLIF